MVSDRFRLRYRLTPAHFKAYLGLANRRVGGNCTWKHVLEGVLLGLGMSLLLIILIKSGHLTRVQGNMLLAGWLLGSLMTFGLMNYSARRQMGRIVGAHDSMIGEFQLVAYEAGGLQVSGAHVQSSFDWTAFVDLTQSDDIMVLWVDNGVGVILPNKAFSSSGERQDFAAFVEERLGKTRS